MTKSAITRERLEELASGQSGFNLRIATLEESQQLARMALSAMDSEPVAYADEAELCFVNDMACMWTKGMGINEVPLYRHAPPADEDETEKQWRSLALQFDGHRMQAISFLKQILKELPATEFSSAREFLKAGPLTGEEILRNRIAEIVALSQPAPVVPDDVLNALQEVARIRVDLNDLDGDCRGVGSCLWEAEERLLEIVAQRSAMLSGGKS